MLKDSAVNKTINEAMTRKGAACLLFAESGKGKREFLTRLSGNFQKTFWFSPVFDDFESLPLIIAEKLFANDKERLRKVSQLVYCRSAFNNEDVIVSYLTDFIGGEKGDFLFVFEQMDRVPEMFDFRIIERLIVLSPLNLKIAVASDNFISFDYSKFEKNWPMLVDVAGMASDGKEELFGLDAYFSTLDQAGRSFLKTFAKLEYIDASFAETIYPNAKKLLETLAKHPSMVSERGKNLFVFSKGFKAHIEETIKDEPISDYDGLKLSLGRYYAEKKDYFGAFKCFSKIRNMPLVNDMVAEILGNRILCHKLNRYAALYGRMTRYENEYEYPYYMIYVAMTMIANKRYDECRTVCSRLLEEHGDIRNVFCAAHTVAMVSLVEEKKFKQAYDYSVRHSFANFPETANREMADIFCMTLRSIIEGDLQFEVAKLAAYDRAVNEMNGENEIWFVRVKETFADAFYHVGNYKKGWDIMHEIQRVVPFYIIPYKVVNYRFFIDGDMAAIKEFIDTAVKKAERLGITQDVSLLYAARGRVLGYAGRYDEAIADYDRAVSLDSEMGRVKFQNIAERVVAYARWKDLTYAREVAFTYCKFAEAHSPQNRDVMLYALCICCYLAGDYDSAYRAALDCVKASNVKSVYWLIGMGLALSYLLNKNSVDNPIGLVTRIMKTAESYGMDSMMVENSDIFAPILDFAKENGVSKDYVEVLEKRIAEKKAAITPDIKLSVKMFGATAVKCGNAEICWKTKKAKELFLHYFVSGQDGMERKRILETMWSDYRHDSAINNLKTTNNIIRKALDGAGVKYKLDYFNGKYVLAVDNAASDERRFRELAASWEQETVVRKKNDIAEEIMVEFNEPYAADATSGYFKSRAHEIEQKKVYILIRTVKTLLRNGDYVEAKRFFDWLKTTDKDADYGALEQMINERLGQNV